MRDVPSRPSSEMRAWLHPALGLPPLSGMEVPPSVQLHGPPGSGLLFHEGF